LTPEQRRSINSELYDVGPDEGGGGAGPVLESSFEGGDEEIFESSDGEDATFMDALKGDAAIAPGDNGEMVWKKHATEVETLGSGRGPIADPIREVVREFFSNIPSLTEVPENPLKIVKERLAPDHVAYWHSETLPNGKPYTVEVHVSPGEPFADVYAVRDFDNTPLEINGFTIDDFEDWSLAEADHIDALFAKEMARTGVDDVHLTKGTGFGYSKDYRLAPFPGAKGHGSYTTGSFDRWMDHIGSLVSSGRRIPMEDMAVLSGVCAWVTSGALDMYKKTLNYANRFSKNPMGAVDDAAGLPARAVDKARGAFKKRNSGQAYGT
jgi:hypothetical protein